MGFISLGHVIGQNVNHANKWHQTSNYSPFAKRILLHFQTSFSPVLFNIGISKLASYLNDETRRY